jgi:hypothetical protein
LKITEKLNHRVCFKKLVLCAEELPQFSHTVHLGLLYISVNYIFEYKIIASLFLRPARRPFRMGRMIPPPPQFFFPVPAGR